MEEEDSAVDVSEVYFLVLHWLLDGPCRRAAQALLQEVEQHGLLPTTHAASGGDDVAWCAVSTVCKFASYTCHMYRRHQHNYTHRQPACFKLTVLYVTYGVRPCAVFQVLLSDVACHTGASRPTPYQQLLQQHRGVPSTGLLQLLQQALKQVQRSDHAGAQVSFLSSTEVEHSLQSKSTLYSSSAA